ncbi:hypothetical protein CHUAL_009702, partial [Chamberlinius hualienensis]
IRNKDLNSTDLWAFKLFFFCFQSKPLGQFPFVVVKIHIQTVQKNYHFELANNISFEALFLLVATWRRIIHFKDIMLWREHSAEGEVCVVCCMKALKEILLVFYKHCLRRLHQMPITLQAILM